jgi:hypothetical protein
VPIYRPKRVVVKTRYGNKLRNNTNIKSCVLLHFTDICDTTFFNKENILLENMLSEKCSGNCLNTWASSGRMRILFEVMNVINIIKVCLCLYYMLIAMSMTNKTNGSEVFRLDFFSV